MRRFLATGFVSAISLFALLGNAEAPSAPVSDVALPLASLAAVPAAQALAPAPLQPVQLAEDSVLAAVGPAPQTADLRGFVRNMVSETRGLELNANQQCLAEAVYFEARGESIEGQLAVAQVIMNRVADRRFPNSICGVVQQRTGRSCQFSYVCDSRSDEPRERRSWGIARAIAMIAAQDAWQDLTQGATHFHATRVNPAWNDIYVRTKAVGSHVFYRKPA
jgi:hypothetical protein